MANVQGIGGLFISSQDVTRLASWYERVLGIELEPHPDGTGYYHVFRTWDAESGVQRENPVFAINQATSELPAGDRGFIVNLRVDDLNQFLEQLRAHGVEIEDRILEWERGRHAWIRDLDGNRLELYEEILLNETI